MIEQIISYETYNILLSVKELNTIYTEFPLMVFKSTVKIKRVKYRTIVKCSSNVLNFIVNSWNLMYAFSFFLQWKSRWAVVSKLSPVAGIVFL